jgi:hypothetical protein
MLWEILTSLDTACGHDVLHPLILFTDLASTSVISHMPLQGVLNFSGEQSIFVLYFSVETHLCFLLLKSSELKYGNMHSQLN